jgi:membrane-associated phospholipid phosphatase
MNVFADLISLINVCLMIYLLFSKKFIALLGIFVLMFLNSAIKNQIRQVRPENAKDCDLLNAGGPSHSFGMPSGHVAIIVAILIFLDVNPLLILSSAGLMCWSRVTRGCHTLSQSITGGILGAVFGIVWKIFFRTLQYITLHYEF